MDPSTIVIGERFRKDLGSLDDLVASIRDVGLIQPVVVDRSGNLIAGERRLAACLLAGMEDVPTCVVDGLADAAQTLRAERDENTCRKDMTPSELVALGRRLEELERPRAVERHQEGSARGGRAEGAVRANSTFEGGPKRDRSGYTREIVGNAIGMAGSTYDKAKAVVDAAADESLPADVHTIAEDAKAEMDASGQVTPAYDKVKRARRIADEPHLTPSSIPPRLHGKDASSILPRFLTQINGMRSVIETVDFSSCRLEPYQVTELDAGVRAIIAVRKTLKENSR